jgi:hypothetical protein
MTITRSYKWEKEEIHTEGNQPVGLLVPTNVTLMRKFTKVTVMLAILLWLCATLHMTAFASSATDFGLTLTLSTDDTEYAVGDAVKITYMAKNDSDYDMVNVRLTFTMPAELSAPVTVVDIPIIPAHTTYGPFTLPDATVVRTGTDTSSDSSDSSDTISQPTVTATMDSPKTGEAGRIIWLVVLLCGALAIAFLVYYCLKKRSKLGTWIAALLLMVEAVTFFGFQPVQAESDEYGLEVSHALILDGKNLSISMSCKWRFLIADENGNPVTSLTKTYGDPDFRLQTLNGMGEGAITWESSDPSIVSVTNDGTTFTTVSILKTTGQNPVTISVTKAASGIYKEMKTSVPITVSPAQLVVTNDSVPASVAYESVLTPTAKLANSNRAVHVTWESSNESILDINVDANGVYTITAVDVGEATITGSADYCIPVQIRVTVGSAQLVVRDNSVPQSVSYGDVLTPIIGIGNNNTVDDVIWTSSDESVLDIRVDEDGNYTIHAVGEGEAIITAEAPYCIDFEIVVTVNPAQLVVTGDSVPESVSYGDVITPTAGIAGDDDGNIPIVNLVWSIAPGDEDVLAISEVDGVYTIEAVGVGEATIIATAENCNPLRVVVTVYPAQLVVTNLPASVTYGTVITPTAGIAGDDDGSISVNNLRWSSNAESILDITNNGTQITAVSVGTATITGSADNCIDVTVQVTVTAAQLVVTNDSVPTSVDFGEVLIPTAGIAGSNIAVNVTWDSDDENILDVFLDENEAYKIEAVDLGTTTITGSAPNCNDVEIQVTVSGQLVVTGVPASVSYGDVITPTIGIEDGDGNETISGLELESSNEDVLAIDEDGIIHALSVGTATITAEADNCTPAQVVVTVSAAQLVVTGDSVRASVSYGDVLTPTAGIAGDDDGSISVNNLSWESSDEDVLEIGEDGNIHALNVGTATIRATADNCTPVDIEVTVVPATLYASLDIGEMENIVEGVYGYFDWQAEPQTIDNYHIVLYLFMRGNELPITLSGWENDDDEDVELQPEWINEVASIVDLPGGFMGEYDVELGGYALQDEVLPVGEYTLTVDIDLDNYQVVWVNDTLTLAEIR